MTSIKGRNGGELGCRCPLISCPPKTVATCNNRKQVLGGSLVAARTCNRQLTYIVDVRPSCSNNNCNLPPPMSWVVEASSVTRQTLVFRENRGMRTYRFWEPSLMMPGNWNKRNIFNKQDNKRPNPNITETYQNRDSKLEPGWLAQGKKIVCNRIKDKLTLHYSLP